MDTKLDTKSISTSTLSQESGRRLHGFTLFSVLTALMLTLLLEALDQTVVSTALPKIVASLQGFDRYTWAVTAYVLASTIMIPIVGQLSDQFGRKWFLVVGTAIFLLGSVLAGASQTMNKFIAFRALQGFGARVGILVTETTRWRWVFYINIPVGIIVLAALLIYLPANISARSNDFTGWAAVRRIDFPGAVLSAAATVCLLLGLTWGSASTYEWSSPQVIGILAAAIVLFGTFIVTERFAVEPILPLDLFRNRVFAVASVLSLLQLMVFVGLIVYLPLFLQGVLGVSATDAGAVITPMTVSSVIGAMLAGLAVNIFKRYRLLTILSALIMTAGVVLLSRMTPTTGLLEAVIFMVIAGIGVGPFFFVLTIAAQNALPRTRLGIGTSAVRYLSQLGAVVGVAIVGTVVNNTLASDIARRIPASVAHQLTPAGLTVATNPQVLVNPTYRAAVVRTAQRFAAQSAVTHVPPSPQHDQIAASAAAQ